MRTLFRNIMAVVIMIGIIYVITNYSGVIKEQVGVKGAETDRAKEISGEIGSDIGEQVDVAKDQAMQFKLQDVVDFFDRFQKIPEDITNAKEYVQDQVTGVFEAREKKE